LIPSRYELRKLLADEDVNIFTAELLNRVASSLAEFDALSKRDFAVFFEPPSLDERIVNQFALFSLPSSPELQLEDLLKRREATYRRIIIPASLKWGSARQTRSGQYHRESAFPGAGWIVGLVETLLCKSDLETCPDCSVPRSLCQRVCP
jgi:hypothetical protein